jgi:hypothetical protein
VIAGRLFRMVGYINTSASDTTHMKGTTMFNLTDNPFTVGREAFIMGMTEDCNPFVRPECAMFAAVEWHRGWLLEKEDMKDATRVVSC